MRFELSANDLRPVVELAVEAALERLAAQDSRLDALGTGRLGYIEPEAAALLGVAPHVLRDARLRGELRARLVGKRYVYERGELLRFLRATD